MGSWQDGHPMTTAWVKKEDPPFKDIWKCGKAESSSPSAIYRPHPEKTLVLHMPKGAYKLCKYIAGSGPMILCYTDWKFSSIDWEISKILNLKLKGKCLFLYLHGHKLANLEHELQRNIFSRRGSFTCNWFICSLTPVPDFSTEKHMKFICNLFEPPYKILPYMWRIGIECKMQQIWVVFYRCEDCACMLHKISLRVQIWQNV